MTTSGSPSVGAEVHLLAWPDLSSTESRRIPLTLVDHALTDSRGDYALGMPGGSALEALAGADQTVDFEVVSLADDRVAVASFSRMVVSTADGGVLVSDGAAASIDDNAPGNSQDVARVDFVDDRPVVGSDAMDADTIEPVEVTSARTARIGTEPEPEPADDRNPCMAIELRNLGRRTAWLAWWSSTTSGVTARFGMEDGASTTLGVGISASSHGADFSAGGTITKNTSAGQDWPPLQDQGNRIFGTYVNYRKYNIACISIPAYWREVRAHHVIGGTLLGYQPRPPRAPHCAPYSPRADYYRVKSRQTGISNGVSLADIIGIDLSAQSGWSREVHLNVSIHQPVRICGADSGPLSEPGQVVAKPPS